MAAESPVANRPPIFYGWWIVAVCLVHMALASGICNLAFPVFFVPFADEFGWTRTAIAGGISITLLTIGLTAPFAGRLTDRYGPRRVMIPATLLSALLLLALSRFNALWQLYALRALLGVTFACMAHLPVNVILAHWFDRYRGRATGIALLGPALGGLLFTPLLSLLVETVGWRTGLLCSAVLMALSLPLLVFAMRDTPNNPGFIRMGQPRMPTALRDHHTSSDPRRRKSCEPGDSGFCSACIFSCCSAPSRCSRISCRISSTRVTRCRTLH